MGIGFEDAVRGASPTPDLPGDWRQVSACLDGVETFHALRAGRGVPLLLVHGIGPGTTGLANFAPLIAALPVDWPLHMIDLAGLGRSAAAAPVAPFSAALWLRQIHLALGRIGRPALLVGNSAGGALALKAAAAGAALHAVVAAGAPAAAMRPSAALRAFWTAPRTRADLADAMRPMTAAAATPDEALVDARWSALEEPGYAARFAAGLSDPEGLLAELALSAGEAAAIRVPVHIAHGREDKACPADAIVAGLLPLLRNADVTLFGWCGHNVLSERTSDMVGILTRIRDGKSGQ